jgi:tRNA pseudouridine38-40 synthase
VRWFRLVVAYDGTAFHGWQIQRGQRTVQGVLEEALRGAFGEVEMTRLEAAGRTDAGVHARGQTVSFGADVALPPRAIGPLVNRRLPADVRVRASRETRAGFSARRSALGRRYAYRVLFEEDLLRERFAWHPRRRVDPERLSRACAPLPGEHDFSAFMTSGSSPTVPVCRISRASWSVEDRSLRFDVVADHFLYRMVRNLVGTAFELSGAPDPAQAMEAVIASRDRRRAGATAPAHGLCLEEVFYPREAIE